MENSRTLASNKFEEWRKENKLSYDEAAKFLTQKGIELFGQDFKRKLGKGHTHGWGKRNITVQDKQYSQLLRVVIGIDDNDWLTQC